MCRSGISAVSGRQINVRSNRHRSNGNEVTNYFPFRKWMIKNTVRRGLKKQGVASLLEHGQK